MNALYCTETYKRNGHIKNIYYDFMRFGDSSIVPNLLKQ